MKNLLTVILLFGLLTFKFMASAQKQGNSPEGTPVYNGFLMNLPGITDAQKEEFTKIRTEHQKLMRQLHALLQEQRAHLNTLRLADKPDADAINTTIDNIAATQGKIMKERESHRIAVRSRLTDEQKAWFDSRHQRKGFGKGRFAGSGFCYQRGPCWNNGDENDENDGDDDSNRKNIRPRRFNR